MTSDQKQLRFAGKKPPSSGSPSPLGSTLDAEDVPPELLDPVDIIRDPVHGDIRLTALERFILGRPEFERLRNINQLALTYVAYPGALHTRHIHSLGTLHVCSEMVETCNTNAGTYSRLANPKDPIPLRIGRYAVVLARLCALMHDLAHVPFGHTLEKEGRVFEKDEWGDARRYEIVFGAKSDFRTRFGGFLADRFDLPTDFSNRLLHDVGATLSAPRDGVTSLPYPFVHDLVGNTICADLIDYVQRDMYFCGLRERFGDRFLRYLAVVPLHEDGNAFRAVRIEPLGASASFAKRRPQNAEPKEPVARVVLLQYRYNEHRAVVMKHDIVAEAIDLVRRRLAVAEKLYFHRSKVAASAMLVAAASSHQLDAMDIWDLTDREVLQLLARSAEPRAARLGRALLLPASRN